MISIGWILYGIISIVTVLLYVDDEVAPKGRFQPDNILPRYGGLPILLNHKLIMARKEGDTETEAEIHYLRKSLFRNRRTTDEQAAVDKNGRARFIAKYGKNGEIALRKTDTLLKLQALSAEEDKALTAEILANAEPEPKPKPKPKTTRKKGGK